MLWSFFKGGAYLHSSVQMSSANKKKWVLICSNTLLFLKLLPLVVCWSLDFELGLELGLQFGLSLRLWLGLG